MAIDNIGLNRFIGILPRTLQQRLAIVRTDARKVILKERKLSSGEGPDFYGPFWSDAKEFFFGKIDLRRATKARIRQNKSRRRMYPILTHQFLTWCASVPAQEDERERVEDAFGSCASLAKDAKILVHGLLGWSDPTGRHYLVFPYFSKDLPLSPKMARLGRWIMADALQEFNPDNMQMLDVLRARAFDNDNCPLVGGEDETVSGRYTQLLAEWEVQKRILRAS